MKMPKKPKPLMGQRTYLKHGGGKCPACESKAISADELNIDGAQAWCGVSCNDCGATWNDVYKLAGYEELEMNVEVQPMHPYTPQPDPQSGKVE